MGNSSASSITVNVFVAPREAFATHRAQSGNLLAQLPRPAVTAIVVVLLVLTCKIIIGTSLTSSITIVVTFLALMIGLWLAS